MAHDGSLPRATSPRGIVNRLPPSSSKDMNGFSRGACRRSESYARGCNRASRRGLRDFSLELPPHESSAQPAPEEQRTERDRRIAVDETPDHGVARQQFPRHVDRHHGGRQHLGQARSARRGRKVEQERDERLDEEDVHEMRRQPEGAHGDVSRQQLVGVRGGRQDDRPDQSQQATRAAERLHASGGPVAAQCTKSRSRRGKNMAHAMAMPINTKMRKLVLNRSYSVMPSTTPCCARERPAPRKIASGPATAKKMTVATKVMNVDVTASGSATPARRIVHIIIGPAPV